MQNRQRRRGLTEAEIRSANRINRIGFLLAAAVCLVGGVFMLFRDLRYGLGILLAAAVILWNSFSPLFLKGQNETDAAPSAPEQAADAEEQQSGENRPVDQDPES